jgi:hypothetical protein
MKETPTYGYRLELWGITGYRATALAYMQREGLTEVKHRDGNVYTLSMLLKTIINPKEKE